MGDCYPSKQGDTKDTITKEKRKDYSSENSGESSDQPENETSAAWVVGIDQTLVDIEAKVDD
ncbi:putative replication protein from bacteriophage origin, partial [Escherichia coli 99.0839]